MFARTDLECWAAMLSAGLALCACGGPEPAADPAAAPDGDMKVLHSKFAGSWYPGRERPLRRMIRQFVSEAEPPAVRDPVRALILPHAGYRYSGPTAAHGIKLLEGRSFKRAVVIGPSHRYPLLNEASLPDATHYGTPLGLVPLDTAFIDKLLAHDRFRQVAGLHEEEHSVQMEVPLLQHVLGDFQLVPIVVGRLDADAAREIADALRGLIDEDTLLVASTDFTHYGPDFDYLPFTNNVPEQLRALDLGAYEQIAAKDPAGFMQYCREQGATVCGRHAVEVLLHLLGPDDQAHLLHYDTSGRIMEEYENSVSYLSAAFTAPIPPTHPLNHTPSPDAIALTSAEKAALLDLARRAIAYRLEHGRDPSPRDLGANPTAAMEQTAGAFVTLNTPEGRLRGCIGDVRARRPLFRSVMANAVHAALNDTRFPPVTPDELESLHLEISALSPMRRADGPEDIAIGRHGVLLRKGGHAAVYLPQVASAQGWDREQTLSHLAMKAGLPADAWREDATLEVFEATVFGEHGP